MKKLYWFIVFLLFFSHGPTWSQQKSQGPEKPLNIVLLIGDGMGLGAITAAMYSSKEKFVLEEFPVTGFQKCHSIGNIISESAANATAMACGIKTLNHRIGVDQDGLPCKTIMEEAKEHGMAAGIIATSSLVHATPAAFFGHQQARTLYEELAEDFLKSDIDFAVGGGKRYFDRRVKDDRILSNELRRKHYAVLDYFADDIYSVRPSLRSNFLFFTADNHPVAASQGRDYLSFATSMAIDYLEDRSKQGFFLVIEGSQIDWFCHTNQGEQVISEIEDFSKAVRVVLNYAKQKCNTLVIVTADHETGGLAINPGSTQKRLDIKFTTNGHNGSMVPLFAYGPGSELFHGIYENTEIYHKMKKSLNWRSGD